jgi:hypothetical protein
MIAHTAGCRVPVEAVHLGPVPRSVALACRPQVLPGGRSLQRRVCGSSAERADGVRPNWRTVAGRRDTFGSRPFAAARARSDSFGGMVGWPSLAE